MHLMVAWSDRQGGACPQDVQAELLAVLQGRAYAEAFPGAYVITLTYEGEAADILKGLQAVAEARKSVWLLVSPPINGGRYNGWLPKSKWDQLNRRATS
jgi:hypothetical protein